MSQQAFPRTVQRWNDTLEHVEGMTLRAYLAGLMMQGLLANGGGGRPKDCAAYAVEFADALLAELAKETEA